ncbi:MAG: hypothetical protein H0T78_00980 [Longispora sp.]|nr:hypothetical protein [Longispora sp. (in: high G+C Gram-positive bacteria)]
MRRERPVRWQRIGENALRIDEAVGAVLHYLAAEKDRERELLALFDAQEAENMHIERYVQAVDEYRQTVDAMEASTADSVERARGTLEATIREMVEAHKQVDVATVNYSTAVKSVDVGAAGRAAMVALSAGRDAAAEVQKAVSFEDPGRITWFHSANSTFNHELNVALNEIKTAGSVYSAASKQNESTAGTVQFLADLFQLANAVGMDEAIRIDHHQLDQENRQQILGWTATNQELVGNKRTAFVEFLSSLHAQEVRLTDARLAFSAAMAELTSGS